MRNFTEAANHTSFSTKEKDEQVWKEVSERTSKAEAEIKGIIIKLNGEQKKEVLANLPNVVKAIDPKKLFDLDKWISITTDALTPIIETLYESEGKTAEARKVYAILKDKDKDSKGKPGPAAELAGQKLNPQPGAASLQ